MKRTTSETRLVIQNPASPRQTVSLLFADRHEALCAGLAVFGQLRTQGLMNRNMPLMHVTIAHVGTDANEWGIPVTCIDPNGTFWAPHQLKDGRLIPDRNAPTYKPNPVPVAAVLSKEIVGSIPDWAYTWSASVGL